MIIESIQKISFEIPVKIISEPNWRGHWAEKYKRTREQKGIVYANCLKALGCKPKDEPLKGEYIITLTRLQGYRERNFDGDNLQGAFKAVRDGISMYTGIDDGDRRVTWEYSQEKSEKPGVRVFIERVS